MERKEGASEASEVPFQKNKAHIFQASFFDEFAEDGEVMPTRSQGVPLPKWEKAYV